MTAQKPKAARAEKSRKQLKKLLAELHDFTEAFHDWSVRASEELFAATMRMIDDPNRRAPAPQKPKKGR